MLRQLDEINGEFHAGLGITLVEEQLLPLPDHAKKVVVQDTDLNRETVLHEGRHFLQIHLKSAITADRYHLPLSGMPPVRPWPPGRP